ncbi:ISC system 2Fe-2S type ferredoxin [Massilia sp. YIM B04103]|uniref:ISC system 2Fe-2S type ferredoxin n=1 Tax=Massilia sp. YIM B04103 TaxID=2963106 RepID=UPI0021088168|nr:ISC system 2Fe-2S type ferredoxin [Massilia sp. YIM B04103]
MTNITVLPHPDYCPDGQTFAASPGTSICDALLDHGVEMDHACGKVGACTTCHLVVREGFASLNPASSAEEDMLDRAWGIEAQSRLSCQAVIGGEALLIEIPKYSINHAKEQG